MKKRKIYGGNLRTVNWTEGDWLTSISLRDWAIKYNYSESGTYQLIRNGRIVARKIKGRWFLLDTPSAIKNRKMLIM